MADKETSGFEDFPEVDSSWINKKEQCNDRSHNPPNMIVVPQGKRYKHVCPSCGMISYIYPRFTFGLDLRENPRTNWWKNYFKTGQNLYS